MPKNPKVRFPAISKVDILNTAERWQRDWTIMVNSKSLCKACLQPWLYGDNYQEQQKLQKLQPLTVVDADAEGNLTMECPTHGKLTDGKAGGFSILDILEPFIKSWDPRR